MTRQQNPAYLLFMLILSLIALVAVGLQTIVRLDEATRTILYYADFLLCAIFLGDFVFLFFTAENKKRYMLTWGWLDLLSSIPSVEILRVTRAARVLRILRILRAVRAARLITRFILERRAQSAVLAAALLSIVFVVVAAIAVLHFEVTPEANIKTPEDAVWWAAVTMTTVGYGDKYPTTTEGRVIAVFLMTAGVGLFGTFSGLVASWFLSAGRSPADSELAAVKRELASLRELIEGRNGKSGE